MSYLDPLDGSKQKIRKPRKVVKKSAAAKKPRRLLIVAAIVVVAVIALLVLTLPQKTTTKTQPVVTAAQRQAATVALTRDVQTATANIKRYLKTKPKTATDVMRTQMLQGLSLTKGSSLALTSTCATAANGYKSWTVIGTNTLLNRDISYQYQSTTNTFRLVNGKTGASAETVQDKTPRNVGAVQGAAAARC